MRKLRSSEKRKWVVNGLLAFGAVSLLTTGFATWIVGVNQREANEGVNVQVDTAQKNNVSFTFEIGDDKDIYVGETTKKVDNNFVNVNNGKDTDFEVGIKITIEIQLLKVIKSLIKIIRLRVMVVLRHLKLTQRVIINILILMML